MDQMFPLVRTYVFRGDNVADLLPEGHTNWTTKQLQRVNCLLREFVSNMKQKNDY